MLFNCLRCGKKISSCKDICPYCKVDITKISEELSEKLVLNKTVKEKYKGTIFSFVKHT